MLPIQTYIWFWKLNRDWQPHRQKWNIFTDTTVTDGDDQLSQQGARFIFSGVLSWPCMLGNYSRKISTYESSHKHTHLSSSLYHNRALPAAHSSPRQTRWKKENLPWWESSCYGHHTLKRGQWHENRKQAIWKSWAIDNIAAYGTAGDCYKQIWSCLRWFKSSSPWDT